MVSGRSTFRDASSAGYLSAFYALNWQAMFLPKGTPKPDSTKPAENFCSARGAEKWGFSTIDGASFASVDQLREHIEAKIIAARALTFSYFAVIFWKRSKDFWNSSASRKAGDA
jgi:hypothetical protein